ncbi:ABC transporter substrate-binding protein [Acrocarpospora phusangensis]|uniref:ABC transporter substrate-binding protein n=1 Tax=Acrocarpospora phusangensis TaxID=1070424 RepID=A0A919QDN1_9ACTN|nr:ABC transporter substrate-binding protein [Acrocarpospora phusangensis]GIH27284.1 ABC transporter substrate-binding protein [Acrocarpospora phusangensis]
MTTRALGLVALLAVAAAACSAPATDNKNLPPVNPMAASLQSGFTNMDRLIEAAQKEGELVVAGLPRDWVNHGEIMDEFADKYGVKVTALKPDATGAQQLAATGAQAPDVYDLSLDAAVANADKFAPYRVLGWQDIADDLKAADGAWYAGYGGYMSIGYDPAKVAAPASYAALLKPGAAVALPGDPIRTAAGFGGVMATSLSGGKPDAARGVKFFADLKKAGSLSTPDKATALLDWDYLNMARAAAATEQDKPEWRVTIPKDAVLASHYVQAINAKARHPAAARLWEEFLFSDEGQNLLLRGYARPVRLEAMEMRGGLDHEALAKLPKVAGTPVTLTIPQQDAAKTYLRQHWPQQIG